MMNDDEDDCDCVNYRVFAIYESAAQMAYVRAPDLDAARAAVRRDLLVDDWTCAFILDDRSRLLAGFDRALEEAN